MNLSPEQRQAVERTGQDVCVIAGPGSGKTRVLTERFAWLVERQGIEPSRILAITFTEKAAREIKERLIKRFAQNPQLQQSIERAWVSTIDGFCTRILREHSIAAGLAPDFVILDQGQADRMLRGAAEEALDQLFEEHPDPFRRLLEALDLSTSDGNRQQDLAQSLIEVYRTIRVSGPPQATASVADSEPWVRALAAEILRDPQTGNTSTRIIALAGLREWAERFRSLPEHALTVDHFRALHFKVNLGHLPQSRLRDTATQLKNELLPRLEGEWLGRWYASLHGLLRKALDRLTRAYEKAKRAESAVDFADLVERTVQLFEEHPALARETGARFDEALMDELQDTNPLQWRLIHLLGRRLFGVGDINQSIYSFRHALPELFRQYRDTLTGTVDELQENYRSRPEILDTVTRTLKDAPGIEPRALIARGEFATADSPSVERLVAQGDNAASLEAELVAERIRRFAESGQYNYGDIAILVRTLSSTEPFQAAFDRFDIPFLVSSGRTFLEARETRDILNFLAALANPLDEIPLVGVLRSPFAGLSDEAILRLGPEGRQTYFAGKWGKLRREAGFIAPDQLVVQALDACGYAAALSERGQANVDKLLGWLRREFRRRPRPLAEIVADLEAQRAMKADAEAPPPDATDAVRMMSIHAAKGLEFKVVFVSALHRTADNQSPVMLYSPQHGIGAKWRHPISGKGESDSVRAQLRQVRKQRDIEEEHRLLYVAMTRAEHRLFLSYVASKRSGPWVALVEPSVPHATVTADRPPVPPPLDHTQIARAPVKYLDLPALPGHYESALTATALAHFAACPRKYYLGTYLRLDPEPTGPGTGAIDFGLAVHKALAGGKVTDPEAVALAERFWSSPLGQRARHATRVEREFDFAVEIDDVVVSGQMDLWFEDAGDLILVDYKTDRDTSASDSYTIQLRLYAHALKRYTGRAADRAYLYYLRSDQALEVDLSSEKITQTIRLVGGLKSAQQHSNFDMRPGAQCLRCKFYQGHCPAVVPTY